MKIAMFGGSGTLGQELLKIDPSIMAPSHTDVCIESFLEVHNYLNNVKPDILIHCAAIIDNRTLSFQPERAININIKGTANIAMACILLNIRMVYLSTDYVYKSDRGNYKETDELLPYNFYAWTKLGGECSVKGVKNHLIIRTSFGKSKFPYTVAFSDKWSNKDYVDVIAPDIWRVAVSPMTGVLNLGTRRKTLFEYAIERNPDVNPIRIEKSPHSTPIDSSMNLQKWIDYTREYPIAIPLSTCRVCKNDNLQKYIDLGVMPLANSLEFTSQRAREQERFPLQVMFCPGCGLSQLSVIINPEKMYSYYTYRSSINQGYVNHCREMAKEMKKNLNLDEDSFMIDIAGNDGTLLKEFKDEIGLRVLNVDPASNLTAIAEANGIDSVSKFWNENTAELLEISEGKADLITATNVFAHVNHPDQFLRACKKILKPDGLLVLEFPYLVDLINNNEFDTIYFEHLSYLLINPINKICQKSGLKILGVKKFDIHGGSVRLKITHEESNFVGIFDEYTALSVSVQEMGDGFTFIEKYRDWAKNINLQIKDFTQKITDLKIKGNKICAFGASAKGNTLLNASMINTDIIDYIVDETPEKIGKFSPGTGIPIVSKHKLTTDPPDFLIILAWNFKEEIMEKLKDTYRGKYIIPIPTFTIL
jgi:ubiquinone/menaquinone biosynthesis C-methylase UbiE